MKCNHVKLFVFLFYLLEVPRQANKDGSPQNISAKVVSHPVDNTQVDDKPLHFDVWIKMFRDKCCGF